MGYSMSYNKSLKVCGLQKVRVTNSVSYSLSYKQRELQCKLQCEL